MTRLAIVATTTAVALAAIAGCGESKKSVRGASQPSAQAAAESFVRAVTANDLRTATKLIAPDAPIPADFLSDIAGKAQQRHTRARLEHRSSRRFVYIYTSRWVDPEQNAVGLEKGKWFVDTGRHGSGWLIEDFNNENDESEMVPRSWCRPSASAYEKAHCRLD